MKIAIFAEVFYQLVMLMTLQINKRINLDTMDKTMRKLPFIPFHSFCYQKIKIYCLFSVFHCFFYFKQPFTHAYSQFLSIAGNSFIHLHISVVYEHNLFAWTHNCLPLFLSSFKQILLIFKCHLNFFPAPLKFSSPLLC